MSGKDVTLHQLELENQKAQYDMMNLMESFQAISSTLSLDEVLKKIMHYAFNIAKSAQAGYIQLYEEHSNQLIIKEYVGFNDYINYFKVNVGESITGKVFRDDSVSLIHTKKAIYDRMDDLRKENLHTIEKAHLQKQDIQSLLSVPVSFGTKRIGVMTLHCFDIEDGLSETDLLLLQSFAAQAAIAIHNAQLHREVQKSLDEVTHLSKQLKEANTLLAKRTDIHNLLTRLSIQNRGLNAIIKEMNKLMENKLVYADYLEGECHPEHSAHWVKNLDDLFLLYMNKTEPAYGSLYNNDQTDCYIYPIRSGSIFLGCLIAEGNSPLSQLDCLIIEQGAPFLSLEIMKLRSQTEIMFKKTYEAYQQFLKVKNPHQAERAAKDLGIHHHYFLQTALIELDGNADLQSLENDALVLLAHLKEKIPVENSLLFSYNNKIFFFSSAQSADREAYFREMIQSSMKWWNERFTVVARAGISTGHYNPGQAEENHTKAEKALLHLKKHKEKGIIHYRDIGISRLFLHHPPEEIESFLRETFSLLWTDHEKNSELLHTLFTYIQNNRSMTATAKDLHIHANTLYHRIKKIEDTLKMDFSHYEDYLKVQLSVYLYKTFFK
ncbi:helix-turn-helix domain-containing protein [Peribacillus butanolivorans]|uniref:helix-turn-helix domain-containing protein n=1 Tax=Peribacillus butanolivorans TaxID=421767 RepID=UPI00369C740B